MLFSANDVDLSDKCRIIIEFTCCVTSTLRGVTCVTTVVQKNALEPQGTPLCKQSGHVPHAFVYMYFLCFFSGAIYSSHWLMVPQVK